MQCARFEANSKKLEQHLADIITSKSWLQSWKIKWQTIEVVVCFEVSSVRLPTTSNPSFFNTTVIQPRDSRISIVQCIQAYYNAMHDCGLFKI